MGSQLLPDYKGWEGVQGLLHVPGLASCPVSEPSWLTALPFMLLNRHRAAVASYVGALRRSTTSAATSGPERSPSKGTMEERRLPSLRRFHRAAETHFKLPH